MLNTYTNIKAEQTILGSLLINSRALTKIPFLKANDFHDQRNRWLYYTILKIVHKHNYVFIIPALKNNKKINMFGGMSYFDHLIASINNNKSIKSYAQLVHHLASLRHKHKTYKKSQPLSKHKDLKRYEEPSLLANLMALGTNQEHNHINHTFKSITKDLKTNDFQFLPNKGLFKIFNKLDHEQIIINWTNVLNYLHKHKEYGLINYISRIMINANLSLNVYYLAHNIEINASKSKNKSNHTSSNTSNNRRYKSSHPSKHNLTLKNNSQSSSLNQQQLLENNTSHNKAFKSIKQQAKHELYINNQKLREYQKEFKPNPYTSLKSSIDQLYGVSYSDVKRAKYLNINNIYDLLVYFPFRYQDITISDLSKVKNPTRIQAYGKIISKINIKKTKSSKAKLYFLINLIGRHPNTHKKVWINSAYNYKKYQNLNNYLKNNKIIILSGVLRPSRFNLSSYPNITAYNINLATAKDIRSNRVAMYGVYKSSPQHQISSRKIHKLVYLAYRQSSHLIKNNPLIPVRIRTKYNLMPKIQVIRNLQFPLNQTDIKTAQQTAKFNEFFTFEFKLQERKEQHNHIKGTAIKYHKSIIKKFITQLPYKLTTDQVNAVQDVLSDLTSHRQMKRLLQGDVGSGKTVVAMVGILATVDAGYQCALMCPTSILAKQHYQAFQNAFKNFHLKIDLLIGSLTPKQRNRELKNLKSGTTNLVIGTSALMQPKIRYHDLAMAVIDEQHRFGVHQRNALRTKGNGVNILSMTATPIPRTMALSSPIYSQLDTSRITHLPDGRKQTVTKWIKSNDIKSCLPIIRQTLKKEEQTFIVVPRIKTTENRYQTTIDRLKQALEKKKLTTPTKIKKLASNIAINKIKLNNQKELNSIGKLKSELKELLPKVRVGILDGEMNDSYKNKVMNDFANNKYQILVSTTVIEVGIDISNACLMIIMNADRYGLATLHQLRGRVGRSNKQAYCILSAPVTSLTKRQIKFLNNKTQNANVNKIKSSPLNIKVKHLKYLKHHGTNGSKRMRVMCSTTDGFKIAEADMKLRGSGNLLGQEQSGMPKFKIGNPVNNRQDRDIMYHTERIVNHIINHVY